MYYLDVNATSKAIYFVRAPQKGPLIISGVLIARGTIAGTVGYIAHRKQRKLYKECVKLFL